MKCLSLIGVDYDKAIQQFRDIIEKNEKIQCSIGFPADFSVSKIIRDMVGEIFDFYGVSKKWRGRFVLIVDELINNAIEHGSKKGDENICKIEAGKDDKGHFFIRLEVHDTGKGVSFQEVEKNMNKAQKAVETDGETYTDKRGRGLFLITKQLVDSLDFAKSDKGGLAVKIEKTIHDE